MTHHSLNNISVLLTYLHKYSQKLRLLAFSRAGTCDWPGSPGMPCGIGSYRKTAVGLVVNFKG